MDTTQNIAPLQAAVARDGSEARLMAPVGIPRELFTVELCAQTLRDAGVQITRAVEQALCDLVQAGPPTEAKISAIVARATAPKAGTDACVEWLVDATASTAPAAPIASSMLAIPDEGPSQGSGASPGIKRENYYEHSAFAVVKPSRVLGRCMEATPGEDGCTVTGKVIPAKPGKPLTLKLDETILRDGQGQLLAQCPGVLIRDADSARISRVLDIPRHVDFSTGHIDFPGDVVVHRGVRDRFMVKAGGHLEVRGIIEGAQIECGGNLTAPSGMAGHERGLLQVGGTTRCANGAMIGGSLIATGPVRASVLGSNAGTPTYVSLGTVPFLEEKLALLERFITQLTQARAALDEEQQQLALRHLHPSARDRERQTEILFEAQGLDQKLLRARILQDTCQQHLGDCRTIQLEVTHRLFHGVVLTIQGSDYQVDDDHHGPLRIGWKAGVGPVYGNDPASLTPLIQITKIIPSSSHKSSAAPSGVAHACLNR